MCWSGTFSFSVCLDFFQNLSRVPFFQTCDCLFHDMRGLEVAVESDEIVRAARLPYVRTHSPRKLKIAILVRSDLAFGLFRIMASIRSKEGITIQVFREYESAAEWLGLPSDADEIFGRGEEVRLDDMV